jgi:hypothetical protein
MPALEYIPWATQIYHRDSRLTLTTHDKPTNKRDFSHMYTHISLALDRKSLASYPYDFFTSISFTGTIDY